MPKRLFFLTRAARHPFSARRRGGYLSPLRRFKSVWTKKESGPGRLIPSRPPSAYATIIRLVPRLLSYKPLARAALVPATRPFGCLPSCLNGNKKRGNSSAPPNLLTPHLHPHRSVHQVCVKVKSRGLFFQRFPARDDGLVYRPTANYTAPPFPPGFRPAMCTGGTSRGTSSPGRPRWPPPCGRRACPRRA